MLKLSVCLMELKFRSWLDALFTDLWEYNHTFILVQWGWENMATACRRHFQTDLVEQNCYILIQILLTIVPVYWCIYALVTQINTCTFDWSNGYMLWNISLTLSRWHTSNLCGTKNAWHLYPQPASNGCVCPILKLHACMFTLDISGSPIDFQWDSRKYPG